MASRTFKDAELLICIYFIFFIFILRINFDELDDKNKSLSFVKFKNLLTWYSRGEEKRIFQKRIYRKIQTFITLIKL